MISNRLQCPFAFPIALAFAFFSIFLTYMPIMKYIILESKETTTVSFQLFKEYRALTGGVKAERL